MRYKQVLIWFLLATSCGLSTALGAWHCQDSNTNFIYVRTPPCSKGDAVLFQTNSKDEGGDILIISDKKGVIFGYFGFSLDANSKKATMTIFHPDTAKVVIVRTLPMSPAKATELGIKVGAAFLWTDTNKFTLLRDVDIHLSDEELCKQFSRTRDCGGKTAYDVNKLLSGPIPTDE